MINELKAVLLIIFSALGSFFMPITDYMIAILMLLGVNFLSGWIEDELHGKGWKWKKAFKTFYECFVMVAIGACLFVIGHYMHKDASAIQCLSVIYFAAIWFYSVNILNNCLHIGYILYNDIRCGCGHGLIHLPSVADSLFVCLSCAAG